MNAIVVILADLARSPIGTRSRLAEPLAGVPVLRRTVMRALEIEGLGSVHVLARPAEIATVRQLLADLPSVVHESNLPQAPHEELVATARKWSLDNWRAASLRPAASTSPSTPPPCRRLHGRPVPMRSWLCRPTRHF